MSLNSFLGAIAQGLLWSVLSLGVYVTYRILDFSDLSTEGSYPLGAAVAATLILKGVNPFLATLAAAGSGVLAGLCTGLLHTKLRIPALLSGILTMTGLYSVNLRIMGKANLPLLKQTTVLSVASDLFGLSTTQAAMIAGLIAAVIVILLLWLFFSTELGMAVRATGDNPDMIRALGVNTNRMKMLGLMIGNALIGLAGGLLAQYNGYADVGMGSGTIVIGLASVIIGEVLFGRSSVLRSMISVVLGSILYRIVIAFVLDRGLVPTDLKPLTSIVLAICLSLPIVKEAYNKMISKRSHRKEAAADA